MVILVRLGAASEERVQARYHTRVGSEPALPVTDLVPIPEPTLALLRVFSLPPPLTLLLILLLMLLPGLVIHVTIEVPHVLSARL
jgi:hypothetical protein